MAFKKHKNIGEVVSTYHLQLKEMALFDNILANYDVSEVFQKELQYTLDYLPYETSEASIGEMIIFPLLKEIWRNFDEKLMIWSHKTINYSKELTGIPDYMIAKKSSQAARFILDTPFLAIVEAKKDDFEGSWAQCALELVTIQKINNNTEIPIWGIVSNGDNWEFGRLIGNTIELEKEIYTIRKSKELYNSLYFIIQSCALHA